MNIALSDTIFYVTGKQGIENSTEQELQTLVAEYPYFAPAQLVYAAKLKSNNSFKLQTQTQKAGLFFNNFKWLQYQLMEVGVGGFASVATENKVVHQESVVVEEKIAEPVVISKEEHKIIEEPAVIAKDEHNIVEEPVAASSNPMFEQYDVAETVPNNAYDFVANMSIPTIEEVKGIMNGIDDKKQEETETVEPVNVKAIEEEHSTPVVEEIAEAPINIEHQPEPTHFTFEKHTPEIVEEVVAPVNDIHAEIAALKANWYVTHPVEVETIEEEKIVEKVATPEQIVVAEPVHIPTAIETSLGSIKEAFNKPIDTVANEPLPFETEPYYTIDYFASQGIKFDYTKDPQDKLTAKMLKFTDWLKKMKSPKPEINIMVDDPELDKAIQNIAATSNQSKEIVTETMAEIFAKQGKTEKAIQLYIKLSFLIPDKSAYFATKIKELKGI